MDAELWSGFDHCTRRFGAGAMSRRARQAF
jgi:hypothetical protein